MFSPGSMRRFCTEHGFFKTSRLPDVCLELELASAKSNAENFNRLTPAYCEAHEFVLTIIIFIF